MATWHQEKALSRDSTNLGHKYKFTVVNDSPGKQMCVCRYTHESDAIAYSRSSGGYIIPPTNLLGANNEKNS